MTISRLGSVLTGEILSAGDLTAAPLTTLTADVRLIENISLGCTYARGGGSGISEIQIECRASYDGGSTFRPVTVNPVPGTPPDTEYVDGSLLRKVSASDEWVMSPVNIEGLAHLQLVVEIIGTPSAGDLLTIDIYGESTSSG